MFSFSYMTILNSKSHHGILPNYTAVREVQDFNLGLTKINILRSIFENTKVCNLWRNFYDVQDNWLSIQVTSPVHQYHKNIFFLIQNIIDFYGDNVDGFLELAGPGGWNDPDMLVIGHNL